MSDFEGIEVHINGNPDMDPETAETLREAIKRAYQYMADYPVEHERQVIAAEKAMASTGTAPQRPKADPQMVTCFQCRGDGTCFATDDPCPVCGGLGSITDDAAPVPQTEGECPDCGGEGVVVLGGPSALALEDYGVDAERDDCPTCSGKGEK